MPKGDKMRLFIAAHFPEETNRRFLEFTDILQKNAKGNVTKPQNLHLTLIFLGEIKSGTVDKIEDIMKKTILNTQINMRFTEIGRFKRGTESLIWAGGESAGLSEIHRLLSSAFQKAGIETDRKKFVPHVTLGRRVQFKNPPRSEREIDEFLASINAEFETSVSRISLTESELMPNGPVYKELLSFGFIQP